MINVTLEVEWFSYRCRTQVRTYACLRCKYEEDKLVCRQCGQDNHIAVKCKNVVDCGNCRHKGFQSEYYMLSNGCPVYSALLSQVNSRY